VISIGAVGEAPPSEIVCDTMEAALMLKQRITEVDLTELEWSR